MVVVQVEQKQDVSEATQGQGEAEEGGLPPQTATRGSLREREREREIERERDPVLRLLGLHDCQV